MDVNLEPNKQTVLIRCKKEIDLSVENALSTHFDKQSSTSSDVIKVPENEISKSVSPLNENSSKNRIKDSFVGSNSKENFDGVSKASTNDVTIVDDVTRTRCDVPLTTFQAKLCDITPSTDTNSRHSNNFMKASDFVRQTPKSHQQCVRIPEDSPLSNFSEPKRPKLDLSQPKISFFCKEPSDLKNSSGLELRSFVSGQNFETEPKQNPGKMDSDGTLPLNVGSEDNIDQNETKLIDATLIDKPLRSWARGNCLNDTQGEIIEPVGMGRPNMTSRPAKTGNDEFEDGDLVLVKRAGHQVQLSPKRPTKRVRKESDTSKEVLNRSIKKFYAPTNKNDSEEDRTKARTTKSKLVRQSCNIDFNVNLLSSTEKLDTTHKKKPFQLLGQLSASGLWLFIDHRNESLQLLNHHRLMVTNCW